MRTTRQGIGIYRLAALLFSVLWVCAWAVTVVTWEHDAAGYSVGMNPVAIPLHLVLPFALGGLVGLGRSIASRAFWKTCALAGLAFGIAEFGILWLVDVLWLPAAELETPFWEMAAGAVVGTVIYAAVCVVLSMLGGKVGRTLARRRSDGEGTRKPPEAVKR